MVGFQANAAEEVEEEEAKIDVRKEVSEWRLFVGWNEQITVDK
jgi:hypothetical protein